MFSCWFTQYFCSVRIISYLLCFLSISAFSQVTLSSSAVNFGDVFTNESKEVGVDVTNITSTNLTVSEIVIYNDGFTYKPLTNNVIEPNKSQKIRVTFAPRHNVVYNSELIFSLSDGSEHRIDLKGNGRYTDTYYDATFNKSYQDLKDELKSIISAGYVNYGYNGARDKMYGDIDNVSGQVTCVYTGRVATFNTRAGATSQNFNCEHTWPQSLFNQNEPERADIHHLFSTDDNANGKRGNLAFGVVSNASWSEGGSKLGNGVFEPRDEQKGATARAMLYFVIRYQDYGNFIDNQETTLVNWHTNFEPSAAEIARNERVFFYQKNRNPFVDHPEFAERISKYGSTDTKPIVKNASVLQTQLSYNQVTPSDERTFYVCNTGNQKLEGFSVSTSVGNAFIKSFENAMEEGEASKIIIGFNNLPNGNYADSLIINLNAQSGQRFSIPIQFGIGTNNTTSTIANQLQVRYNQSNQKIEFIDGPQGLNEVQVYTIAGKRVFNEISTSFTDISTVGYIPGVYFVVVSSESDVYTSKILVY